MKATLILLGLLVSAALFADQTTVTVNNPCASGTPQTGVSLGAALGCTITQINTAQMGTVWTVTCAPDWNPTAAQIARLTALINAGQ